MLQRFNKTNPDAPSDAIRSLTFLQLPHKAAMLLKPLIGYLSYGGLIPPVSLLVYMAVPAPSILKHAVLLIVTGIPGKSPLCHCSCGSSRRRTHPHLLIPTSQLLLGGLYLELERFWPRSLAALVSFGRTRSPARWRRCVARGMRCSRLVKHAI